MRFQSLKSNKLLKICRDGDYVCTRTSRLNVYSTSMRRLDDDDGLIESNRYDRADWRFELEVKLVVLLRENISFGIILHRETTS